MAKLKVKQDDLYFILSISRKRIFLISISGGQPSEVKDGGFPMTFSDDYEYARSVIGTSFGYSSKGYEKDKSILKEKRREHVALPFKRRQLSNFQASHKYLSPKAPAGSYSICPYCLRSVPPPGIQFRQPHAPGCGLQGGLRLEPRARS